MIKQFLPVAFIILVTNSFAQITPAASPKATVRQDIGLSNFTVEYYRPSKNGREIFGKLVPYNQVWRTGANGKTLFTCSDNIAFGKDTLRAGTYSLYSKPDKENWEIYFNKKIDAPGWVVDSNVVLTLKVKPEITTIQESFRISFENIKANSAQLELAWDNIRIVLPFTIKTLEKAIAKIETTIVDDYSNNLNAAAAYFLSNKQDLSKALKWVSLAIELNPDAFWIYNTKCRILKELGKKEELIAAAKKGKELAQKEKRDDFIKIFDDYISGK